jgi:hypothetical protein
VIDCEPVAHAPLVRPTLFAGIVTIRADAFTTPTSGPRRLPEITMSRSLGALVSVKIIPNEHGTPVGKRADVKVVFESEAGPLSGAQVGGLRKSGSTPDDAQCYCAPITIGLAPERDQLTRVCPSKSHFTGTSAGAPLSLIMTTRNFAGWVLLAFRSTI